jgi:hypothetical protein
VRLCCEDVGGVQRRGGGDAGGAGGGGKPDAVAQDARVGARQPVPRQGGAGGGVHAAGRPRQRRVLPRQPVPPPPKVVFSLITPLCSLIVIQELIREYSNSLRSARTEAELFCSLASVIRSLPTAASSEKDLFSVLCCAVLCPRGLTDPEKASRPHAWSAIWNLNPIVA